MRYRLKDVAAAAGVSVKTVSNVVNGYVHVRPETRARVEQAIAELKYQPNLSARSLRQGRTGLIALAVPELDIPYFAELARHIVAAAKVHDWAVLIDPTNGDPAHERLVAAGFRDQLIDGLIFSPLALTGDDPTGYEVRTPMILLGERVYGTATDHVVVDNVGAARTATEHLIGIGRRRIAAIGAIGAQRAAEGVTARLRLAGYTAVLREAGLPHDETLIAEAAGWHRADGAAAMHGLLRSGEPPDAVFCFNDTLALGAIRALLEAGLRVPEDVAVVGFDDIEDGRFSTPTLTTIAPDKAFLARTAVAALAERVAAGEAPLREITVPYRLQQRESTGITA